jgi:hypothetical protein
MGKAHQNQKKTAQPERETNALTTRKKKFLGFWTLSIVWCLKEHDVSETGKYRNPEIPNVGQNHSTMI